MVREIIATGRGSDAFNYGLVNRVRQKGIDAAPLELRAEVFQGVVQRFASQLEESGDKDAAWELWWNLSTVTSLHKGKGRDGDEEYARFSLSNTRQIENKEFRRRLKTLRALEKLLFGENKQWLSIWNSARIFFEEVVPESEIFAEGT